MFSSQQDLASAAALFKNPVPTHGARRNTACQQCRKRKLKCDTKRPCGTCVRSHHYARSHPPTDGLEVPNHVECTYGDEKEVLPPSNNKVENLENRIVELEALLQQMQVALEESQKNVRSSSTILPRTPAPHNAAEPSSTFSPVVAELAFDFQPDGSPWFDDYIGQDVGAASGAFDVATGQYSHFAASESSSTASMQSTPSLQNMAVSNVVTTISTKQSQLLLIGWPEGLPDPEVTRHLVHAFFAFHLHAGRIFHGPTFLASLDLPPTDSRFPFHGILHAMCAIGSLYTADIPQPSARPRMSFKTGGLGLFFAFEELFTGKWRQYDRRPDSFAESQATLARIANEVSIDRGEHLLECLQVQILLTWFYHHQARWSEAYMSAGHTLRGTIPCGLNIAAPFNPAEILIGDIPDCPPTILGVPNSSTENEIRRNIFWIAYILERTQAASNIYAMTLDDLDVCQLLPLRGDQFEQGIYVTAEDRQWSHDRSMFLTHPPNQTDSFILFIKSVTLLSHIKNFNLRFRGRYFSGDIAVRSPWRFNTMVGRDNMGKWDARDSPAFQELDHIATMFRQSFPNHLKNPTQDDMVDPYLFSAFSATYLAQIILHEPYADMNKSDCVSRIQILKAARGVLELTYGLSATSYDVSLLDHLPILAWNLSGRILVNALRVAINKGLADDIVVLHAEILYLHDMLAKAGERTPLAYRYKKVIYDYLAGVCGQQYVQDIQESPFCRKQHASPPLNQYDLFNSMGFVQSVYSPGTYAMDGAMTEPQM